MSANDRYARQRLIEWWDQEKLRAARVLVAGAGALGNEVLKNLALLGVGRLLVIDFDRIERSNLSRTVLFNEKDVGRSKVEAAASALARLNPDTTIHAIDGDLFHDVGLGRYRHADLAIGCLDNLAARSQVGLDCVLAGVPYLDGGMWSMGGEVRWFTAGDGPCFDCTLTAEDRARGDERRSCSGFLARESADSGRTPTVVSTAAIIGGMQAQEAAKYLCGHPITPGKAIVYNGQALTMHRAELARDSACPSTHAPYENVIELNRRAADVTPAELFPIARDDLKRGRGAIFSPDRGNDDLDTYESALELGRDFLLALRCPECGDSQKVNRPRGKVSEKETHCPRCGAARLPEDIRTIGEGSPHAVRTLADLGVPAGEALAVHIGENLMIYELTGDMENEI